MKKITKLKEDCVVALIAVGYFTAGVVFVVGVATTIDWLIG
jgi:hypothetical protein